MSISKYHVSKNLWNEAYTGLTTSLTYFPKYVGDGEFTISTTTPNNAGGASLFFLRGERTENLCPTQWQQGDIDSTTGADVVSSGAIRSDYITIEPNKYYSIYRDIKGGFVKIRLYDENKSYVGSGSATRISLIEGGSGATPINPLQGGDIFCCIQVLDTNAKYMRIVDTTNNLSTLYMFVEGEYTAQTMPNYEPYGYKLPVVCGGSTTNIYLSEPIRKISTYVDTAASTGTASRVIKKIVLDGTETIGSATAITGGYRFSLQYDFSDMENKLYLRITPMFQPQQRILRL